MTVETGTVQRVVARNVKPDQRFSTSVAVYYAGYSNPYYLGYDETGSSTPWGTFKAYVPMELLESFYGPLRPVEYVEACVEEIPSYDVVGCSPQSFVGWTPESIWPYG